MTDNSTSPPTSLLQTPQATFIFVLLVVLSIGTLIHATLGRLPIFLYDKPISTPIQPTEGNSNATAKTGEGRSNDSQLNPGTFGDSFGFINSVYQGLTCLLLMATLYNQLVEYRKTEKDRIDAEKDRRQAQSDRLDAVKIQQHLAEIENANLKLQTQVAEHQSHAALIATVSTWKELNANRTLRVDALTDEDLRYLCQKFINTVALNKSQSKLLEVFGVRTANSEHSLEQLANLGYFYLRMSLKLQTEFQQCNKQIHERTNDPPENQINAYSNWCTSIVSSIEELGADQHDWSSNVEISGKLFMSQAKTIIRESNEKATKLVLRQPQTVTNQLSQICRNAEEGFYKDLVVKAFHNNQHPSSEGA